MKKKALLLISAILVLLFSTGCSRARNDFSQNSQPVIAATSGVIINTTAASQPEAAPTQAVFDSPTQPETTLTLSVVPTTAVQASVAQITDDLNEALNKALDDLDSTDDLNDLQ